MKIGTLIEGVGPAPRQAVLIPSAPPPKVDALAKFTGEIGSALKADALKWLSIKVRPIETSEAAVTLADQRAQVKLLLKDIEHRRKQVVEPLNKEVSSVNAEAHRWTDPLAAWDKEAERALLAYQRLEADRKRRALEEQQRAIEEAARKQAEAEAVGNKEAAEAASVEIMKAEAAPVAAPVTGYKTDAGTTSKRTRWVVEVVKPEEVPDVYLVPDIQKLQAAVTAGARDIPGCYIHEEESLSVRTRG